MTSTQKCGILLCAAAAFLAGSCTGRVPSPHVGPPSLATCNKSGPNPGRVRETIGSGGGTVRLAAAGHSLRVPAGVVPDGSVFTMEETSDPNHVIVDVTGPSGTFSSDLELTLSVRRCVRQDGLKVLRVGTDSTLSSSMHGAPGASDRVVRAGLNHLSQYAVAE